jgi:hypothetical protein
MRNTYEVRIRPTAVRALMQLGAQPFSPEVLGRSLAGATIRQLSQEEWGDYTLTLHLQRETHEQALNEILLAVQEYGYWIVAGTVNEWANAAGQAAFAGVLGGGAIGSRASDPWVALGAIVFGGLLGAAAGSFVEDLKVVYQVRPGYPSGWVLTPMPRQAQAEPAFQPGFTPS